MGYFSGFWLMVLLLKNGVEGDIITPHLFSKFMLKAS